MDSKPAVTTTPVAVSHRLDLIPQHVITVNGVDIPGAKVLVYMRTLHAEGFVFAPIDPRVANALVLLGCATIAHDGTLLCSDKIKQRLTTMLEIFEASYNALMLHHEASQKSDGGE